MSPSYRPMGSSWGSEVSVTVGSTGSVVGVAEGAAVEGGAVVTGGVVVIGGGALVVGAGTGMTRRGGGVVGRTVRAGVGVELGEVDEMELQNSP